MRYRPGDMVRIQMNWMSPIKGIPDEWSNGVGVIVRAFSDDDFTLIAADAGAACYDYQLLLNGQLLYFHENELISIQEL